MARVEGIGPKTLTELKDLSAHTDLAVKAVIDLAERVSTHAYEHPDAVAERIHLLRPDDGFPQATSTSRNPTVVDLDHVRSYDHTTPPGAPPQTTSHTSQPLTRTPHRAKTHLPYRVIQVPTGEVVWTTPHGCAASRTTPAPTH